MGPHSHTTPHKPSRLPPCCPGRHAASNLLCEIARHRVKSPGVISSGPRGSVPEAGPSQHLVLIMSQPPGTAHSSQFKNNFFAEMWSGSEEGPYSRLIDCCITQL